MFILASPLLSWVPIHSCQVSLPAVMVTASVISSETQRPQQREYGLVVDVSARAAVVIPLAPASPSFWAVKAFEALSLQVPRKVLTLELIVAFWK